VYWMFAYYDCSLSLMPPADDLSLPKGWLLVSPLRAVLGVWC
jgi:hypothetical protein